MRIGRPVVLSPRTNAVRSTIGETTRSFQLWEYSVSHGHALVRSPRGDDGGTNRDIVFFDVEYLALPRHLGSVELKPATDDERFWVELQLGKPIDPRHAWVLESDVTRYIVIAARAEVRETNSEVFESPFDPPDGRS